MFKINLKNGKSFLCNDVDTILIGAQKENVVLEYSCKTGRCQSCKAKVIEGTSVAEVDETGLTIEEKSKGYILTCVRTPTSDLNLDIEDLSDYHIPEIRTLPAKVDKIVSVSSNVIELHLRIPPNVSFDYLSGQYINIIKEDYKRSYSIANTSTLTNLVFFIKNYEGGRFSNYLFNEVKINDLLRIEGPVGTFFYRKTNKKNIVLLATGTGIAPVKAILEQLNENNEDTLNKKIYLFFGGRKEEDLFWEPCFNSIEVNYYPVLSQSDESWKGDKGYVQDALISKKIDLSDSVLYACGSENMIKDSKELVLTRGLAEELFYSDAFISSK